MSDSELKENRKESGSSGSITEMLSGFDGQETQAIQKIWDEFFARLCRFAESRIYNRHKRLSSGEDIASITMQALFQGFQDRRFQDVRNRDDLWQLLTLIASRKTINVAKNLDRERRGGGRVRGDSALGDENAQQAYAFIQHELTPSEWLEYEELSQELFQTLPNDSLREVAELRLAGLAKQEIAANLKCHVRTIERKLKLIRSIWETRVAT